MGRAKGRTPAPTRKRLAKSATEYFEIINETLESAPWFGRPPYEATIRKTPPKKVDGNLFYIRRILLSWLIGRPVSDIAKRVGCSERLVRRVVRDQIYATEPNLQEWNRLGLIGLVDVPACRFDDEEFMDIVGEDAYWSINPKDPLAVCFICHRMIGWVKAEINVFQHSGSLFDLGTKAFEWWQFEFHDVQGHLITHFWLDTIQFAVPEIRTLDPLTELIGRPDLAKAAGRRLKAGRAASKRLYWWDTIDSRVWDQISPWQEDDCPRILPVREGREISETQAEREWSAWLRGNFD